MHPFSLETLVQNMGMQVKTSARMCTRPLQGNIFRDMKRREGGARVLLSPTHHPLVQSSKRPKNLNVAFQVIVKVYLSR